ncbi:MAG: hypothetical protein NTZ46_04065 [Verrucomicrobia bacterium]|nr:hypothetical protein [Verrucomicrobiota bacterium]
MKKRGTTKRLTAREAPQELLEERRERQRAVCLALLERWVPVAASAALALRTEGKSGPVIDEEPLEAGLKAGGFVLKVLERLARIDGLDAAEKRELTVTETADPAELARRVRVVSPVLMARLRLEGPLIKELSDEPPG